MNSIDEKIRTALATEDEKALEELGDEAGLVDMLGMALRGKQAWMSYFMYFLAFASFFAGLYFLNKYFSAPDLKTSLSWALAVIACMFSLSLTKIMGWQQLHKLEMMREIKRLEMRLILVIEKINPK